MQDINPHLALLQSESYVSPEELKWEAWVDALALLLGFKNMDGDQMVDGYSLDWCYDVFTDGCTVADAAAELEASWADDEHTFEGPNL